MYQKFPEAQNICHRFQFRLLFPCPILHMPQGIRNFSSNSSLPFSSVFDTRNTLKNRKPLINSNLCFLIYMSGFTHILKLENSIIITTLNLLKLKVNFFKIFASNSKIVGQFSTTQTKRKKNKKKIRLFCVLLFSALRRNMSDLYVITRWFKFYFFKRL